MTIKDFQIGNRFQLRGKGHVGCVYEVVGFWKGDEHEWMEVRDLSRLPLSSTGFNDVNLAAFTERNEIVMESDGKAIRQNA